MKRLKVLDDGVIYRNPEPGMRAECAFLPNVVPLGYRRIKIKDGEKERPSLEIDVQTAPIVRRIFTDFLELQGLKDVIRSLAADGITSPRSLSI